MFTLWIIMAYFVFRITFQLGIHVGTESVYSLRKKIIGIGFLWLPIVTVQYSFSVANYDPCSMCVPPMPVAFFLAWIAFLVTDYLYQILMLSRVQTL
ncbi:MAG: hypothetical protein ACFFDQ_11685 [Candidatus Thorarchaeota archaeon]